MLHIDDVAKMSCSIGGCTRSPVLVSLDRGEMPLCAKHASAYLVAKARACKAQVKREKAATKAAKVREPKPETVLRELRTLAHPTITIWAA